jgi:hypothetical protein
MLFAKHYWDNHINEDGKGHVARAWAEKSIQDIWSENLKKSPLLRPRRRLEDDIKMYLKK